MSTQHFNDDLLHFLAAACTPFHAVQEMARRLDESGFTVLHEADNWDLAAGSYYTVRNGSSIVAFTVTDQDLVTDGFRMIGAHTDSPCLKVKPQPEVRTKGYFQLGVEVYGGALLNPWFDRDLSLAGRVNFKDSQGAICSALVDFKQPIATVPSLAIHLDREANKGRTVNPQTDIVPLLMIDPKETADFRQLLQQQVEKEHPGSQVQQVLDYEMSFYDTQAPALVGLKQDFIASARLDNLLSCYIGLQALISSDNKNTVLVCSDHEEVGSQSAVGAQGPMLKSILLRLLNSEAEFSRVMSRSMMISADNAHGIHPNFADKHDDNHGPLLNAGVVIKTNANQRYATNSNTSSLFKSWCEKAGEPVQSFVVRTDMACGSTIGPITASELGVETLDIGVPTFAMHSIRELAGSRDAYGLYQILLEYLKADVAVKGV